MSFSEKLASNLGSLKKHPAVRRFIRHNKRVFQKHSAGKKNRPVVLFELNSMQSAHIAYSYLANVLSELNGAEIQAYAPYPHTNWREQFMFKLRDFLGTREFGVYKSFGVSKIFGISPSKAQKRRAKDLFDSVKKDLKSKFDLESLTIDGIWVGDLIYDTYLRTFKEATIDINASKFHRFLLSSLELFTFWEDYFSENNVRGVNVSHCVYNLAMPLRVAVQKGIPAYQASPTHVYRLNSDRLFAYNEFFHYRERFAVLPAEVRKSGIAEAKRRIEMRFSGEVGVDMAYSTKSAYGEVRQSRLLRESSRKKILIATHCFFDSPHSYGNNIFPDFYEWLEFLGQIGQTTDYDWYIKTHPDYLSGTMEIIKSFVGRYPKFTLLPSESSHHQIIEEGIDLALTVYGTIAFEYAALGILVINASQNNPHIMYDFNLHAKDIDDYRQMIEGFKDTEVSVDPTQIYEFYYMRHLHSKPDILMEGFDSLLVALGGYGFQFTDEFYSVWLDRWSSDDHREIFEKFRKFVISEKFQMSNPNE